MKVVKLGSIIDFCDAQIPHLYAHHETVALAQLRGVKEIAKDDSFEINDNCAKGTWLPPVELGVYMRKCSACLYAVTLDEANEFDFCPKCGAIMGKP